MTTTVPLARREFLQASAGLLAAGLLPAATTPASFTIGLIADPHHGLAPDAQKRLDAFMAEVARRKPDFIMQLGDFCHPPRAVKTASGFLKAWSAYRGPRFHVLGNHDLDLARSKREILDAWGAKEGFYSFDHGGMHFAVLDCNFVKGEKGKYLDWSRGRRYEGYVSPEQLDWLKADLAKTKSPTVILSHQGFGPKSEGGVVPNGADVRKVIADANSGPGGKKVVLCLHGHNHLDAARIVGGVHYVEINSASYLWVGEKYGRMAPYTEPLFAFLTLSPAGMIELKGKPGAFSKPTPEDRGLPDAKKFHACISDRKLRFVPPGK
jgi:hypothetical protein